MRHAPLSLLTLLVACSSSGGPSDPGPGGKADDGWDAPYCSVEDAEAVSLCLNEGCPDLEGEALEICLQETCGQDLERIDAICEDCVIGGVVNGDEPAVAAANCSAQGPEPQVCSTEDLEWLFFCGLEGCPGLSGDELHECMEDTCGEDITSIDQSCRDCYVFYDDAGELEAGIEAYCGPGEVDTEPACVGEDASGVSLCLSDGCPDAAPGRSLEICLQETCGEDLERAAPECSSCVYENVDGGHASVLEACLE